MISGECIKIIGLNVNCFEAKIVVDKNMKNDALEARRIIKELSVKYPNTIWITTICSYKYKSK